jgi:hypothetical protein
MATEKRWCKDDDLLVYLDDEFDLAYRIIECLLYAYGITGDDIPDHILDAAGRIEREEAENLFPGGVPGSVPTDLVDQLGEKIAARIAAQIHHAQADQSTRYVVWDVASVSTKARRLVAGLTCQQAVSFRIRWRERNAYEGEIYVYPEGGAPWEQLPGAAAA